MKPHQTAAKVIFIAAFESDFGFSLRERKLAALDDAQIDPLELEANFASTGKSKGKSEQDTRRRGKEKVSTSNQDKDSEKMEEMRKMIKNLVKLEVEAKNAAPRSFQNAPNRIYNPQYRRPPLQILQKEIKEQQDRVPHPLYLEGPVDDSTEDASYELEDSNLAFSGADYYCKQFADFMQAHLNRKYDLRSSRKRTRTQEQEEVVAQKEVPTRKELAPKKFTGKGKSPLKEPLLSDDKIPSSSKIVSPPHDESVSKESKPSAENKESKEVIIERSPPAFNLQKELGKVKIPVPLTKLLKKPMYQSQVTSLLLPPETPTISDSVNLQEERPIVMFGPHIEEIDPSTPPFYVSLVIHDLLLHNCMLDSAASHKLMPLSVMEQLGIQITCPYKDLYSFDSKRVKCLGMIKDLVVNLAQIPAKSVVMNIVVADILARFGMLLSRS